MLPSPPSDNDKTLDANSQNLASQINALAKQGGFQNLPIASAVESSVIGISQWILDQKVSSDIRAAAKAMDQSLTKVIETLKEENSNLQVAIDSKTSGIETTLRSAIGNARGDDVAARFFYLIQARSIIQGPNPSGSIPVTQSAGATIPPQVPTTSAAQLNAALDVVKANQAIANASTGGIVAAVNDLTARAQAAQAMRVALNK